ncbi:VOC family protein [Streptomyces thermolilacinus]|uniref:VOC family protein n=1 Tax=Streptomyces thermolilacinus TaxID=285540 RepID=UPI00041677D4
MRVLGYVVPPPPDGFATWDDFHRAQPPEERGSWFACVDPSGVGPRLYFQRVPEGKTAKNRVHLDVRVATGPRGRGATRRAGGRVRTADPARRGARATAVRRPRRVHRDAGRRGNEFCLD